MINNKLSLNSIEKELLTEKFIKKCDQEVSITENNLEKIINELARSSKMYDQQDIKDFLGELANLIYY